MEADSSSASSAPGDADPSAEVFFGELASFHRRSFLRWIDTTKRRPDERARRIAEMVDLLLQGKKQRPNVPDCVQRPRHDDSGPAARGRVAIRTRQPINPTSVAGGSARTTRVGAALVDGDDWTLIDRSTAVIAAPTTPTSAERATMDADVTPLEESHMVATIGLVLDCTSPEHLAPFWSEALGFTTLGGAGSYVMLIDPEGVRPKLLLQAVPEAKSTKNRMHLDIETPDVEGEATRLESLGARRLESSIRTEHGTNWVIMADPEGNEFCVCDGGSNG